MSKNCCQKKCGPQPVICAPCRCKEFTLTVLEFDLEAKTALLLLERDGEPYQFEKIGVSSTVVPESGSAVIVNSQCRSFTTDKDGQVEVTYAGTGSAEDQVLLNVNIRTSRSGCCVRLTAVLTPDILLGVSPLSYLADDVTDLTDLRLYVAVERSSRVACTANMIDHSSPGAQQGGPGRSSRALALVQIAAANAFNAVEHKFAFYGPALQSFDGASAAVAIAQATHDVLVALYNLRPAIVALADDYLAKELANVATGAAKARGILAGQAAAASILAARSADNSDAPGMNAAYVGPPNPPGPTWSPAPAVSNNVGPMQLGLLWGTVTPFALDAANQFRAPAFPTIGTPDYTYQHEEVKSLGGDGSVTLTARNQEETEIGIYWACDGTANVGTPPRVYMLLAVHVLTQAEKSPVAILQALGRVAVSMADAGICAWETKYLYNIWRPILGVRNVFDPTVVADRNWLCLGAPSNSATAVNFTPPFPAYVSGHSTFGSALFESLRKYVGDDLQFSFVSPEYNGKTVPHGATDPRPFKPRTFARLSQAEWENSQSRMYLGVHYQWDAREGAVMGRKIANWVSGEVVVPSSGPAASRAPVFGPTVEPFVAA